MIYLCRIYFCWKYLFFIGCLLFLCFVDCVNIIFCNGRSDGFLHHIRGFPMSLIPNLKILSVVMTNAFLDDMILALDLLLPVNHKIKLIF